MKVVFFVKNNKCGTVKRFVQTLSKMMLQTKKKFQNLGFSAYLMFAPTRPFSE